MMDTNQLRIVSHSRPDPSDHSESETGSDKGVHSCSQTHTLGGSQKPTGINCVISGEVAFLRWTAVISRVRVEVWVG